MPTTSSARQSTAVTSTATSDPTTTTQVEDKSSSTTSPVETELVGALQLEVLNVLPHDPAAFTQGLAFLDGDLLESLGLYKSSEIRRYPAGTEQPVVSHLLGEEFFGGGIAVLNNTVVQLTWLEKTATVYAADTLEPMTTFSYDGEGWGLCHSDEQFVMSDGSSNLQFRDTATFVETGSITVTRDGQPVDKLNELECVNEAVWANVWLSNEILRIDSTTGEVIAWVDASDLVPTGLTPDDVLNGIAYSAVSDTYFLTGKRWNEIFEVRLTPTPG